MIKPFFALLLYICSIGYGQAQINKLAVIGDWVCREAKAASHDPGDAEMKKATEVMIKAFLNAHFIFREDGIFNLQLPPGQPAFMNDLKFLDNRKWFVDPDNNMISIGTKQENLMHIQVKQEGSFLLFAIAESPLILKMEKQ